MPQFSSNQFTNYDSNINIKTLVISQSGSEAYTLKNRSQTDVQYVAHTVANKRLKPLCGFIYSTYITAANIRYITLDKIEKIWCNSRVLMLASLKCKSIWQPYEAGQFTRDLWNSDCLTERPDCVVDFKMGFSVMTWDSKNRFYSTQTEIYISTNYSLHVCVSADKVVALYSRFDVIVSLFYSFYISAWLTQQHI